VAGRALLRPGNARDAAHARRGRTQAPRALSRLAATALALSLAAAGCTTLLAGGEAPLERTWQAARIFRPGGTTSAVLDVPVVVYAHGCGGFDDDLRRWADLLTRQGYAVIAPDHQARGGRLRACSAGTLYGPGDVDTLATRDAEIHYALRQVRTLPWVRQAGVFLLGVGQGAVAAAGYGGPPFTGYILTAWTCTSPYPRGGLMTALTRPVLAIRWAEDPWFKDPAWNGDCGASLGARPSSRSIILDGAGHSVAADERAQRAVVSFLQLHTPR
jgi:dienelactone hydrolase